MSGDTWHFLARLAELVERGEAKIVSLSEWHDGAKTIFKVTADHDPEINAGLSDEESAQLCEMLSQRFAERALALGLTGEKQRDCLNEHYCVTCSVGPSAWCRPTHPGERDTGGWVHPERVQDPSTFSIGPLRDPGHVTSAMHRFLRITFKSKRDKDIARAQILHAAAKFGIDASSFVSVTPQVFQHTAPDIARGFDLDRLIADRYGLRRREEESDSMFRARAMRFIEVTGQMRVRFALNVPVQDEFVGRYVRLLSDTTVALSEDGEPDNAIIIEIGDVARNRVDVIMLDR